ncbi:stage II sporulation protein P [Terrisporobacter glycolicus]|nr:stage II sporulation protein P [Terrisporobacter glycolicus]
MIKNKIKAIKIGFLIVCILPTISQALDKEDILKYLVKSSYPEVKVIDKEDKDNKDSDDNSKSTNNIKSNTNSKDDKEYVNVYVGEENKPESKEEKKSKETSNIIDSSYTNDIRVTKDKPQMLIYHTHSSETYSDSPKNNYHSTDIEHSVMSVGSILSTSLSEKGWGVVHTTKYNDLSYNDAYATSAKTIKSILSKYNSIKVSIDLHRDGQSVSTAQAKKSVHDKYTTKINGETVAKFFLVVGQRNQNVGELKRQAEEITALAEKKYPGLVCPVVTKQYGRFNQYMADNGLLIEIGNNATSTKEAQATCKYLAEILDEYYSNMK